MHFNNRLTAQEISFDEKFSFALVKHRENAVETGRNALPIMINKGIIYDVKNLTAISGSPTEEVFSVMFDAFMNKEVTEKTITENFTELKGAKKLLESIVVLIKPKDKRCDLIASINGWTGTRELALNLN